MLNLHTDEKNRRRGSGRDGKTLRDYNRQDGNVAVGAFSIT